MAMNTNTPINTSPCYHCGDTADNSIQVDEKSFCCNGCKQVYLLLNENNLCNYYELDKTPGIKAMGKFVSEKFAYLEDADVIKKLVQFNSDLQINVTFLLPQMHCSSCIFLLENLHRIDPGIITSQSNFQKKEVFIVFNPQLISLRKVVELLAFIGYEPEISLQDTVKKNKTGFNKMQIYKIGVAGFCFANIMMLSFPEYFASGNIELHGLKTTFIWLNLALSLPVLFFSATGFFESAYKSIRQKYLNIDTPIALAIVVTYARSYYEIIGGTGAGYLDSGTGIVFFMLVGRWFQNRTYDSLSFDRDYRSYFPLGVTIIQNKEELNIPVTKLKTGDHILLRNEEMVPADAILLKGEASIDYSFVSGENTPVKKQSGDLIYAGGKQLGSTIELEVVKDVSQSYITQLWNNEVFAHTKNVDKSYIHPWSKYFTLGLFSVAAIAVAYWWVNDPSKILPALTSVLIVACPCSLLLTATFTYGNMLRVFGKNKMFLKNSSVIETLARIDSIVFDKTGTITNHRGTSISFVGNVLDEKEKWLIKNAARQSSHPLSKMIYSWAGTTEGDSVLVEDFHEYAGSGLTARIDQSTVSIGSAAFISKGVQTNLPTDTGTHAYVAINNQTLGKFEFGNLYRQELAPAIQELLKDNYTIHLLSGDNNREKPNLEKLFGKRVPLLFQQSPQEKLDYVKGLQADRKKVLMVGDGLNDAGALMQSDTGISVSDNTGRFSPACDAILDGAEVHKIGKFLAFARSGKKIITAVFILSILYNIVGLSFAVQAKLAPVVAAILMPASTISIILITFLLTYWTARNKGL